MPDHFHILGVARTKMSDADFRARVLDALPKDGGLDQAKAFSQRCHYISGDYNKPSLYRSISDGLKKLDKKHGVSCKHIFYLSTPPSLYPSIIQNLGGAGLTGIKSDCYNDVRVVIEKPFGHSLQSAKELNENVKKVLRENQIYRIDHYLGKETVQNILMFRFANVIFEPVWNRTCIDNVQITASEQIGIGHRAGYYEQTGVIRDMFQNHLLQIMSLIAMEPPTSQEANAVRDKKVDVFKSVRTLKPFEIDQISACGQYGPGKIDGKSVLGYRKEEGVNPKSNTATFAAIKLEMDNWRWQGVPFYIRSGKRMAEKIVDVVIQFKHVPTSVFKPLTTDQLSANVLKFRIQPDAGIVMQFEAKHPGPKLCVGTVTMDFGYQETFKVPPPESYVRLFQDAMLGDQTLFARSDEVLETWRIVDPIIELWESKKAPPLPIYPAGSRGPKEADSLLAKSGRSWG